MARNNNGEYSYRQAQHYAAPRGPAIFVPVPRAMFFSGVRGLSRPHKVYHKPVYIPSPFNTRLDACANSNSLVGSPISSLPFANHPRGSRVTAFWESPTVLQDPAYIFRSPSELVTPVHESLPLMAFYDARLIPVREEAVSQALTSLLRNTNINITDCYRSAVRHFLRRSVDDNILDLVRRIDLEVDFALKIIRATKQPEQYTLEQLTRLQALGKSFLGQATTYRQVWLEEVTNLNLWPDPQANVVDADEFQRYIGGRDWDAEWVRGTREEEGPEDAGSGGDADMMDVDDTALAGPEAIIISDDDDDDNSSAADEDEPTIFVRRGAQGVTTWATIVDGQMTAFARYEHGAGRRPWRCLLCDRCHVVEKGTLQAHLRNKHDLTGLHVMKVENENYSNFQGHDDQDCYIWGEYIRGDLRPWKCLLCRNHPGVQAGKKTFARHFQKTHGIRVVLPPVEPKDVRRHNQKRQQARS